MRHQIKYKDIKKSPSQKKKNFTAIRIILIILLITNLVSFMVWQNIKGLELDEQINHLERSQPKMYNNYQELIIEYEKIRNSDDIKRFAIDNLGMTNTKAKDFIFLGISDKQKLLNKFLKAYNLEN